MKGGTLLLCVPSVLNGHVPVAFATNHLSWLFSTTFSRPIHVPAPVVAEGYLADDEYIHDQFVQLIDNPVTLSRLNYVSLLYLKVYPGAVWTKLTLVVKEVNKLWIAPAVTKRCCLRAEPGELACDEQKPDTVILPLEPPVAL